MLKFLSLALLSVKVDQRSCGSSYCRQSFNVRKLIYSVISPEGCASILWKVEGYDEIAANSLKITSEDLKNLKVIDKVTAEPLEEHRNPSEAFNNLKVDQSVIKDLIKKPKVTVKERNKYLVCSTLSET